MSAIRLLEEARDYVAFNDADMPRHAKASIDLLSRIDAMLKTGGWIPVSERLPDEAGMYITCGQDREYEFTMWEGQWCYSFSPYDPMLHDTSKEITHWQPFPPLPEDK